jgi:hypothetical protein
MIFSMASPALNALLARRPLRAPSMIRLNGLTAP